MLTDEQRRAFDEDGFVALHGVVPSEDLRRMRERIWRRLEHNGAVRADPSTWRPHHTNGLRPISRSDPDPRDLPVLVEALDDLFGPGVWRTAGNWGQVLVTFPTEGPWTLPHRPWHLDHPYRPQPDGSFAGTNVFLFVDDVEPEGGGTVVVRGSPRHVGRFIERARPAKRTQKQWRTAFDAGHPWFRALSDPMDTDDRVRRFTAVTDIDGIPTQVVELTGRAGDVVVCHPWLIHNIAPNVRDRPRMMRASRAFHTEALAMLEDKTA